MEKNQHPSAYPTDFYLQNPIWNRLFPTILYGSKQEKNILTNYLELAMDKNQLLVESINKIVHELNNIKEQIQVILPQLDCQSDCGFKSSDELDEYAKYLCMSAKHD